MFWSRNAGFRFCLAISQGFSFRFCLAMQGFSFPAWAWGGVSTLQQVWLQSQSFSIKLIAVMQSLLLRRLAAQYFRLLLATLILWITEEEKLTDIAVAVITSGKEAVILDSGKSSKKIIQWFTLQFVSLFAFVNCFNCYYI